MFWIIKKALLFYFISALNLMFKWKNPILEEEKKENSRCFQSQLDNIPMCRGLARGVPFKTQLGYLTTLLRLKQQKLSQFWIKIIFK